MGERAGADLRLVASEPEEGLRGGVVGVWRGESDRERARRSSLLVTRLVAESGGDGRPPRLHTRTGAFAARLTRCRADGIEASLVATIATLLGGDSLRLEVVVRSGVRLALTDVAATVAQHGRGLPAHWDVSIVVEDGAALDWRMQPLIVSDGADVRWALDAQVAPHGSLTLRDSVVLGRSGQRGGRVEVVQQVDHGGLPVLRERTVLSGVADDVDQGFVRGPRQELSTRLQIGPSLLGEESAGDASPESGSCPGQADTVVMRLAGGGLLSRTLR
ncbi:urease accessory protein UreD [Actinomycetota bacterium]